MKLSFNRCFARIGDAAFFNNRLTSVTIPDGVTSI
jgi:hypothetical protein